MPLLYSFLEIGSFQNNASAAVNPVGEISTYGRTFARDVGIYANAEGNLLAFEKEGFTVPQEALIATAYAEVAAQCANIPGAFPAVMTILEEAQAALDNVNIAVTAVGNPILNPVDGQSYPEFIELTWNNGGDNYPFKIWLCDASWKTQYPKAFFEVIAPINDPEMLYDAFATAKVTITNMSVQDVLDRATSALNGDTITGQRCITLRVYNKDNPADYFDCPFIVAFNGGIGANISEMINAISDFLTTGSAYTYEQWVSIIPELLPLNSFWIIPNWDNTAVDNPSLAAPLYSPTVQLDNGAALAAKYWPEYLEADVLSRIRYATALYKSLGFYAMGDSDNPDGWQRWDEKFPDYMVIALNDINISQLHPVTQQALRDLDDLVRAAEAYETGDLLDPELVKVTKGVYDYIAKTTFNVRLLVVTRESYLANL